MFGFPLASAVSDRCCGAKRRDLLLLPGLQRPVQVPAAKQIVDRLLLSSWRQKEPNELQSAFEIICAFGLKDKFKLWLQTTTKNVQKGKFQVEKGISLAIAYDHQALFEQIILIHFEPNCTKTLKVLTSDTCAV